MQNLAAAWELDGERGMASMSKTIRVLQVPGKMDMGGVSSVIMNYYRHMDKERVQFDFAVNRDCTFPQEAEIAAGNSRIYRVSSLKNIFAYITDIYHITKRGNYKIVHAHINTLNIFPLMAARMAGAKVRICHNHSTANEKEKLRKAVKDILKLFSRIFPTHYAACSYYAAEWIYGKRFVAQNNVMIIRNGIEMDRFSYDIALRNEYRKRLEIEKKYVLGCVGRFVTQKNHQFLIEVFQKVYAKRKDAVLLLVGEGKLREHIQNEVKRKKLSKAVIFIDACENVNCYYQAMDMFLLPSLYEGFSVVTVEAQVCGLPCIVSKAVPEEAVFTDRVFRIPIEIGADGWSKKVLGKMQDFRERKNGARNSAYDIESNAKELMKYYIDSLT